MQRTGTREEEEEARTLQAYLACVLCTGLRFSNKDKVPIPIFSFLFLVLFLLAAFLKKLHFRPAAQPLSSQQALQLPCQAEGCDL